MSDSDQMPDSDQRQIRTKNLDSAQNIPVINLFT